MIIACIGYAACIIIPALLLSLAAMLLEVRRLNNLQAHNKHLLSESEGKYAELLQDVRNLGSMPGFPVEIVSAENAPDSSRQRKMRVRMPGGVVATVIGHESRLAGYMDGGPVGMHLVRYKSSLIRLVPPEEYAQSEAAISPQPSAASKVPTA